MDIRPSIDSAVAAFGFAATVTPPGGDPVETSAFWQAPPSEEVPADTDLRRVERKRVLVVAKVTGLLVPRQTIISAPEYEGADAEDWQVDAVQREDFDHWRLVVVPSEAT